ncbi:hypothetical protein [Roseomonas mucosa]|uniref:hypothetical protein n=1 Tax=Roseomonas mucosa TaxID=207340 RepID=UPI001EF6DF3B|nr:hypothetical protein [Roseomonas mucosa]MCG7354631.1 hypothetical protein [Roseomonas mucosa]
MKVTTELVPLTVAEPPEAVCAALPIQTPPVAKRPQRTMPARPIATLPPSRFCGWRDCQSAQAPPTRQISAATYIAMEPRLPPAVVASCAMVPTWEPMVEDWA